MYEAITPLRLRKSSSAQEGITFEKGSTAYEAIITRGISLNLKRSMSISSSTLEAMKA